MRETGVVTAVNGESATVKVNKKSECDKCGLCLFPNGAGSVDFHAMNPMNAEVGDNVAMEKPSGAGLFGAVLAFLVPLLLVGTAVIIGLFLLNSEIWIGVLGVIFVVSWYTILAVIDKKLKKKKGFCPVITEILNKEENDNE